MVRMVGLNMWSMRLRHRPAARGSWRRRSAAWWVDLMLGFAIHDKVIICELHVDGCIIRLYIDALSATMPAAKVGRNVASDISCL